VLDHKFSEAYAHISNADILDQGRVKVRLVNHLFHDGVKEELQGSVLKAALESLGQWRSNGESNNNIVSIFGCTAGDNGLAGGGHGVHQSTRECGGGMSSHGRQS
jgi:hypothetical protein